MEFPDLHHSKERPKSMQIQISQAVVSNCRVGEKCTQPDILNDLQNFIGSRHYADMTCFPNIESDTSPISNSTWLNDYSINYHQLHNLTKKDKGIYERLRQQNNLPKEIWCVWFDQFWIEFIGIQKACERPVPFVHAFPLRLWFCQNVTYVKNDEKLLLYKPYDDSTTEANEHEFKSMHVVYDAQNPHHVPVESVVLKSSSNLEMLNNPKISKSSTPSLQLQNYKKRNAPHSKFYIQNYFDEDVKGLDVLRASHSESDLFTLSDNYNASDTQSLNDYGENYQQDVPPPPYTSKVDNTPPLIRNTSVTSLPPEYLECDHSSSTIKTAEVKEENSVLEHENAAIGILFSVSKTVKIQIDHFQLLFLLRVGELFTLVSERIAIDNLRSKDNCQSPLKDNESEIVVFNVSVPNVVIDLILSPCNGIDPIQRLPLFDRVRFERERARNGGTLSASSNILPLRKIDASSSLSIDGKENFPGAQNVNGSEHVYTERLLIRNDDASEHSLLKESASYLSSATNLSSHQSPSEILNLSPHQPPPEILNVSSAENFNNGVFYTKNLDFFENQNVGGNFGGDEYSRMVFESQLKGVRDAEVQVGDSFYDSMSQSVNQLISVLRVRIGAVTVGLQVSGNNSVIKLAAETLALNELGNLNYSQILDNRGNLGDDRSDDKDTVNMNAITGEGALKLRIISGSQSSDGQDAELSFAEIRMEALVAALLMSTLDNLAEFAEDEFIIPQMSFNLRITNSDISLYDDKPRRYLSAIKPPPMQMIIEELRVSRDKNGIITFNQTLRKSVSEEENTNFVNAATSYSSCERADINSITITDAINQHVDELIGENARLLDELKVVNAKVIGLHMERESLLKVIDKLQHELIYSNKENDGLQRRIRSAIGKNKENFV